LTPYYCRMARNTLIQLLVFTLVFIMSTTQAWGDQDCYQEKDMVLRECTISIITIGNYIPPSNLCCRHVRSSDMVCVCRKLEPSDEVSVSPRKLVRVAEDCRKPLPPRTKCGSKCHIFSPFQIVDR
jgi:hypothetical protein